MSASPKPLILLYGESANDTHALEWLIRGILPSGTPVDCRKLRAPTMLPRGAAVRKRAEMAKLVAAVEREEAVRRSKVIVVAHRDCDAFEPAHVEDSRSLEADLRSRGVSIPIAATPAWSIEAWWLLFADEVRRVRPCWKNFSVGTRQVGLIENPKEYLVKALRPTNNKNCPDYTESDSIKIAEEIARSGKARMSGGSASASFEYFKERLVAAFQ